MHARMNHHRTGSGPPLVLIHGVGHYWQAWTPVIDRLAKNFDVIACDSPGFGRSAALAPTVIPTVEAYADAYERFFAELGLERPHVAGNSMGGAIGLELARREALSSLTAFAPVGFWTDRERRFCQLTSLWVLVRMPAVLRPTVLRVSRTPAGRTALFAQLMAWPALMPDDEAISTLQAAWAAPAFGAALDAFRHYRFSRPEQLPDATTTPITIAWGARDWLLLYSRQAPRARRALPRARHLTLGAGHLPFYDDPAAVASVIERTVFTGERPSRLAASSPADHPTISVLVP
jgi:pimeloyl-ACP methyl ester carboxylesterase